MLEAKFRIQLHSISRAEPMQMFGDMTPKNTQLLFVKEWHAQCIYEICDPYIYAQRIQVAEFVCIHHCILTQFIFLGLKL